MSRLRLSRFLEYPRIMALRKSSRLEEPSSDTHARNGAVSLSEQAVRRGGVGRDPENLIGHGPRGQPSKDAA